MKGKSLNKNPCLCFQFHVTITKNPGLGFSIAGGIGSYGNPFRTGDRVSPPSLYINCKCLT